MKRRKQVHVKNKSMSCRGWVSNVSDDEVEDWITLKVRRNKKISGSSLKIRPWVCAEK